MSRIGRWGVSPINPKSPLVGLAPSRGDLYLEARMNRINPYKSFTGAWIPNWLLERSEISVGAKVVYARLAQYAGKDGVAFPKIPELAEAIGTPIRTLQRYLTELKDNDLIETVYHREKCQASDYFFLEHEWMDTLCQDGVTPHAKMAPPSCHFGGGDIKKIQRRESKDIKKSYGRLGNVKLTDEEFGKLENELGSLCALTLIENLSLYLGSKGDKYKSHYATILNWDRKNTPKLLPDLGFYR